VTGRTVGQIHRGQRKVDRHRRPVDDLYLHLDAEVPGLGAKRGVAWCETLPSTLTVSPSVYRNPPAPIFATDEVAGVGDGAEALGTVDPVEPPTVPTSDLVGLAGAAQANSVTPARGSTTKRRILRVIWWALPACSQPS
jgi:hypothetical protein